MAGVIMPNVTFSGVGSILVTVGSAVPAAKAESVCLMAAIDQAETADNYISVYLGDAALPIIQIINAEPMRYRVPGGNPVLLMNFILTAGQYLIVQAIGFPGPSGHPYAGVLFNRWRFDA